MNVESMSAAEIWVPISITLACIIAAAFLSAFLQLQSRKREEDWAKALAEPLGLAWVDAAGSLRLRLQQEGKEERYNRLPLWVRRLLALDAPWRIEGMNDSYGISIFGQRRKKMNTVKSWVNVYVLFPESLPFSLSVKLRQFPLRKGKTRFSGFLGDLEQRLELNVQDTNMLEAFLPDERACAILLDVFKLFSGLKMDSRGFYLEMPLAHAKQTNLRMFIDAAILVHQELSIQRGPLS